MLISANNREGGDGKGIKDEEELGRSIYHIKVNFSCLNLLCSVQRLLRRKFEGPDHGIIIELMLGSRLLYY